MNACMHKSTGLLYGNFTRSVGKHYLSLMAQLIWSNLSSGGYIFNEMFIITKSYFTYSNFKSPATKKLDYFILVLPLQGAGAAQSVLCLTTDWTTGVRSPTETEDFSSSLCIQTSSGAHPATCTMGTGSPFLGVKCGRDVMLTTHPHLVPRLRMNKSYTSSHPKHVVGSLYLTTIPKKLFPILYWLYRNNHTKNQSDWYILRKLSCLFCAPHQPLLLQQRYSTGQCTAIMYGTESFKLGFKRKYLWREVLETAV
jgi:hypothetical protein